MSHSQILAFNVSNDTLVEMLWDIIANEEAIKINQQWAGSPGKLVTTIVPPAHARPSSSTEEGHRHVATAVGTLESDRVGANDMAGQCVHIIHFK